jgi:large subunit ribosomal protein L2
MSLHKAKPTSAGRRFVVQVKTGGLHKGKPYGPLLDKKSSKGGRNHNGRITVRHQGGGHKQRYRIIDFKRDKDGVPGIVERLEYDPNRSAHIALIKYADGERRYILAPNGLRAGAQIISGEDAPIKPGNALPLRAIPVGTTIHNVEMPLRSSRHARASMRRCACVPAKCAGFTSTAAQRWVKSGTANITSASSVRLAPSAGAAFARRSVALP